MLFDMPNNSKQINRRLSFALIQIKMKRQRKILTLLLFLTFTIITNQKLNQEYSYEDFQIQFERNYVGQQRQLHKGYFQKNYAEFLKARQNNPDIQINQFLDWSDQQKKDFFSYKPNPAQATQYNLLRATGVPPPDTLDYRALGKVSPVKNQGSCGCCWSFSSTAAFESQLLLRENKLYDLSQQYVLQCQSNSFGCSGGYSHLALTLLNQTGSPLQSTYPYQQKSPFYTSLAQNTICSNTSSYVKLATPATKIQFISTMTQDQIKAQLATYGPINIGVKGSWNSFMYAPSTGFINDCPSDSAIDHSILLVGYTATHWIVKNSWGTIWGDQGFGYINRTSDCGLKRYMVLFETPQTPPPAPTKVNITIDMTDSRKNGWQGWVLGLMQGTTVVANFTLSSGGVGKKIVQIDATTTTKVYVISAGTSTASKQIGFKLSYTSSGTVIYTRIAGNAFYSTTVFTTFCPSTICTTAAPTGTVPVTFQLTDNFGDGNQGNSIEIISTSGSYGSFGQNFIKGHQSDEITLYLKMNQNIKIKPKVIGYNRQQMGYKLISLIDGQVIAQLKSGKDFAVDAILSEFIIKDGATATAISVQTLADINSQKVGTTQNVSQSSSSQDSSIKLSKLEIGLISSTCVLAVICLSLATVMIIKNKTNKKEQAKQNIQSVGSACNLHKQPISIGKQTMNQIK